MQICSADRANCDVSRAISRDLHIREILRLRMKQTCTHTHTRARDEVVKKTITILQQRSIVLIIFSQIRKRDFLLLISVEYRVRNVSPRASF